MFGQYSYSENAGRRYTKEELASFARWEKDPENGGVYFPGRLVKTRKGGHNRLIYERDDGSRGFMLHQTTVIQTTADGRVILQTGGWASMTTRRAIMDGAAALECAGAFNQPRKVAEWSERTYRPQKAGTWAFRNVWGGSREKAENAALFGHSDGRQLVVPFDNWLSYRRNKDGGVNINSIRRDSSEAIRER